MRAVLPVCLLYVAPVCTPEEGRTPARVDVSSWHELPGGFGDALAVDGEYTLAASPSGVWIWKGAEAVRTAVPSGAFAVGSPRWLGGRVLYGTGYEPHPGGFRALQLPTLPGAPRAAAWRADGTRLAVLWVQGADGTVLELSADGAVARKVWEGSPAPQALWCGAGSIVGLGVQLQAWRAGHEVHVANAHAGGIAAVSSTRDESRLLTVGWEGTAKLWRTDTWAPLSELRGDWASGSLAPNGQSALLLTRSGELHGVCIHADALRPAGEVSVPDRLVAISMGDERVVGSFREGARVRTADVQIRCDAGERSPPP